jgi:hypothetical protein
MGKEGICIDFGSGWDIAEFGGNDLHSVYLEIHYG